MPTRLWGRDAELAVLQRCLTDAYDGRATTVVVAGEAGIGKTALLTSTADRARADGWTVNWSRGLATGGAPPYWLWHQLLGAAPDGGDDRFALFEAVRMRVVAMAPVLLLVDDLQWVDEPSLLALTYLVRRLRNERVLVAASLRTGEALDAWRTVGTELLAESSVVRVDVGGLDAVDSARCLTSASGAQPPADVVAQAVALARGNPFYLSELGRTWQASGQLRVPDSVVGILAQRLSRLSTAAQELLAAAAVVGEEPDLAVVARCLERDPVACLPALQEALDTHLLTRGDAGTMRFAHGLVRSALLQALPLQQLVTLHERAALAIEALHADALDTHAADIARHWAEVSVTGKREPAVHWATRAADLAMQALAFEEASRLYDVALDCAGPGVRDAARARLLLGRAAADLQAGWLAAARDACRTAAAIGRREGDAELLATTALTLDAIGDRAWDRDVYDWCRDALALVAEDDLALRARLLARVSDCLVYDGAWDRAVDVSADALSLAEQAADDDALIAALRARQLTVSGPEHHEERVVLATRMTEIGQRLRRPVVEMWGRLWAIDAHWEKAQLPAIAAEITRLRWCVDRVGSPVAHWHSLVARAALAQAQGELDEALRVGAEAFELMHGLGHPAAIGAYMSVLGAIGHHRGHEAMSLGPPPELALDHGEMRAELFAHIGPAFALADAGRTAEALQLYRRPGPPASWDIPPFFRLPALAVGAHLAVLLGQTDDVAFFRAALEPHRDGHVVGGAGVGSYLGPVVLLLGRCAAAVDDLSAAEDDLRTAVRVCQDAGVPGFAAESQCELAVVLQRQGRSTEAHRLLGEAAGTATRLGMAPWVERIRALTGSGDPLTARQREVAQLVARGLSNREIAARLVVSERTAANHVQQVLTKLGFSRRSQIAAWVPRSE